MADIMDIDLNGLKIEGNFIIKKIRGVFIEKILRLPHTVCFFLETTYPNGEERTVRFTYSADKINEGGFHSTLRCNDGRFVPFITEELSLWLRKKGDEIMIHNEILPVDALFTKEKSFQ